MQRYLIRFSYDGTAFHGFQIQPDAPSVQAEMERALSLLTGQKTEIVGAGRTDAGVHARQMAAHFDLNAPADLNAPVDLDNLTYRLNKLLPPAIAVSEITAVDSTFHARFSAKWRTYHYYIHTAKDPFLKDYSLLITCPLDIAKMNLAAQTLLAMSDFAAFAKSHTDVKTTLCEIKEARWVQTGNNNWYFAITANRFLRGMVRAITGTLIDVGRGKITLDEFTQIAASHNRCNAGDSLPARALFLESVEY
ncbi:MAG: tRNA pseudouridine(38-40) synthase TruA [Prevotella sp.]|nr:tRNA pseudouridine(38-40) synthase TruA [Prevotella sp.]